MDFFVKDIEALRAALIVALDAAEMEDFNRGTLFPFIDGKKVEFSYALQGRVTAILNDLEEAIHNA